MRTAVLWAGLLSMLPILASNAQAQTAQPISSPSAWVAQTVAPFQDWNKVAYGNGTYVSLSWTASVGAYSTNGGVTWTQTSMPTYQDWVSIAYGNGLFVAPAYGANVAVTSPDGIHWTTVTLPASENWNTIAYGNGIFVTAADNSTAAAMSTDGIHWTATTMPGSGWTGITYGNGRFVAVAAGAKVAATSVDGIHWVQQTLPASAQWHAVSYGNGVFAAIAQGSSVVATSADGVSWSQAAMPVSAPWSSIAYGEAMFVAVAGTGTAGTTAATSPDGITWTSSTLPTSSTWSGVVFANHQFVAVAPGNVATMQVVANIPPPTVAMTGPSSGTWSQPGAIPLTASAASNGGIITQVQFFNGSALLGTATQSPYSINWNNGVGGTYSITAVATDNAGNTTSSSPLSLTVVTPITVSLTSPVAGQTAIAPATLTLTATASDSVNNIALVSFYNGATLLGTVTQAPYSLTIPNAAAGVYNITAQAIDSAGFIASSSSVSVTVKSVSSPSAWVAQTIPSSHDWNKIAYGNGTYVSLSWTASVGAYSTNGGVTWTQTSIPTFQDWVSIAYGNGLFVAPAYGANVAVTSPDGIHWTQGTLPATENWNAITYGNGIFVAAANNSTAAAMSTDGIHWTATTMPGSTWTGITYGNGRFVAVASGGNVAATSVDGINWVKQTLPASASWQAIAYGNGVFAAIAQGSSIVATSVDGVSWSQAAMPTSAPWSSVAYGKGLFVAVAGQNTADTIAATSPDGITWTSSSLPTSSTWSGVVFANSQFVAVAPGNAATMQVVSNIPPPTVTVTGPSTWSQSGAIPLTATAASNGGTITQVQFFNGSTLLGTATQSPYSVNWNNVAAGTYSITAVATDNAGNTTSSSAFSLTVVTSIAVSMANPANGSHMTNGNLTLTANAVQQGGVITQVAFYNGSALMGTVTQPPYSISFPEVALGTYTITAQATGNSGLTATSNPITVTVVAEGGGSGGTGSNGEMVYDIHTDQLNTPRLITDSNGNAVWQWDSSDPFGANLPNQDPNGTGNKFVFNPRFAGQYFDQETGMHYNNFRDYDPTTGRYLESDPIGLLGGLNTYGYAAGNPIKFIDPAGLAFVQAVLTDGTTLRINNPSAQDMRVFIDLLPNQGVTDFTITGHANPSEACLNDDCSAFINGSTLEIVQTTKGKFGKISDVRRKIIKGGRFEFSGCNTADGDNNMTKRMSNNLPGILVTGGDGYQLGGDGVIFGDAPPASTIGLKETYVNGVRQ